MKIKPGGEDIKKYTAPLVVKPRKPGGQVNRWGQIDCPECSKTVYVSDLEKCPRCGEIVCMYCIEGGVCLKCGRDDLRKRGLIE